MEINPFDDNYFMKEACNFHDIIIKPQHVCKFYLAFDYYIIFNTKTARMGGKQRGINRYCWWNSYVIKTPICLTFSSCFFNEATKLG